MSIDDVVSPRTDLATAPAAIPQSSLTSTIGGYLYPNPPDVTATAISPPSRPMMGVPFTPMPPPP